MKIIPLYYAGSPPASRYLGTTANPSAETGKPET